MKIEKEDDTQRRNRDDERLPSASARNAETAAPCASAPRRLMSGCTPAAGMNRKRRRIMAALERAGVEAEDAAVAAMALADEPTPVDPAPVLLSDRAAAAWLGVSRATFWRRVKDGTLPQPVKLGRATRWRRDALLEAVDRLGA